MFQIKSWNNNQALLKKLIKNPESFVEAKKLLLLQHASLHSAKVSKSAIGNYEDELWKDLSDEISRKALNKKKRTILYGLWHATRIEDMTMNILVANSSQVFKKGNWQKKINAPFAHTGNSLTPAQILDFSSKINIKALRAYRIAVGKQTQSLIKKLKYTDLKRKFASEDLKIILKEKGVLTDKKAVWLIDFWGKKTVEGLLFMPATRHILIHLNESFEAKKRSAKA